MSSYLLFSQGMFILFLIFGNSFQKIAKIGVVNRSWMNLLKPRLDDRKWTNNCVLHELVIPTSYSFYQSILKANELINNLKIDIIIGDSRLDIAQAAAYLSVPFIAFDSKINPKALPEYDKMPNYYSLPVSEIIYAQATIDILNYYRITRTAIIIDETVDYKSFIQPFFETKNMFSKVWTIVSTDSFNDLDGAIEATLKDIRSRQYTDIIVKMPKNNLVAVMAKAKYFGMTSIPFRWYLPNFVCENFNFHALKHIFTNFTFINEECSERYIKENAKFFETSLVNNFLQLIRLLNWTFDPQTMAKTLKNNPKSRISFGEDGNRNQFMFFYHTISRLPDKMISMLGSWRKMPGSEREFHYSLKMNEIDTVDADFPAFMRIIAIEEHPHLIVKSNGTYVGFGVDLAFKLAESLNFTFTVSVVSSYGDRINGTWDGLVGELIYGKADLSLGPLVQTKEREEILDFSTTFKQREISLVMKKPKSSPSFFQFLGPFSGHIWLCLVSSIILLVLFLWTLEHFHEKYFPEKDRIKFNLKESSWFILASTLQGGTENVPFSIPGRILTATLYFFVIIIVTSYTANLAAFLTVKASSNPIKSVDDLVNLPPDSNIKFGTVDKSAIHDFFKHSEISVYQKIYALMTTRNQNWLVKSSSEGYRRAMKENYVFIWDDSVNQYEIYNEIEYKCQLYIVGRPFGKRSFAVGMPQGACYKEKINTAILHLLESGIIENLEHKWWKSNSICSMDSATPELSSGSLTVAELAGVFLVLLCGVVVAVLSLVFKIIIYKCRPLQSIRDCCQHFFAHLPRDTDPPIAPLTPNRSTIDRSKQSATISSTKTDVPLSPSEIPRKNTRDMNDYFEQNDHFDFQSDDTESNQTRVVPV